MELPKPIGKLKQLSLSIIAARLGMEHSGSNTYEENKEYRVIGAHLRPSLLLREVKGQDRYQGVA